MSLTTERVPSKTGTPRQLNLVRERGERPDWARCWCAAAPLPPNNFSTPSNGKRVDDCRSVGSSSRSTTSPTRRCAQALSVQLNVPFLDLDRLTVDPALGRIINRSYAKRHSLLPIARVSQSLTICMDDPTNHAAVEELRASTGRSITVVTATHDAIVRAFDACTRNARRRPGQAWTDSGERQ